MDAATGEVSEAGLERAEVVLLEADLAASTALDMAMLAEWRWGINVWVWGVEEKGKSSLRGLGNRESLGGRGWIRYVGGFLMFAVKSASTYIDYSDPCMALCASKAVKRNPKKKRMACSLPGDKGRGETVAYFEQPTTVLPRRAQRTPAN